jgi:hypothetical protein
MWFLSERQGPLTDTSVRTMIARAGELPGLGFPVHPHQLRHGCGYTLADEQQDTRAIRLFLGHCHIQHTVTYTELAAAPLKDFRREECERRQVAYSQSLTSLREACVPSHWLHWERAGRPYGQRSLINITVHNTLSTVPHEPQDTGIRPFSAPRPRCWSGKRSTPWLPSAHSICPRAGSRHGRATSIPRTVAPHTTPVGAMVSIAPSPMHAQRVPADRHLSANASRLSHAHAR